MTIQIRRTHLVALALILAGGALAFHLHSVYAQQARVPAGPMRVAVCNVAEVFSEYERAKELSTAHQKRLTEYKQKVEVLREKIEGQRQVLGGLKEGSPQYQKTLDEIRKQYTENKVWEELEQDNILRTYVRLSKDMYEEVKVGIAAVAKEQNIDIVLQLEGGELVADSAPELIRQIDRRKVLYYKNDQQATLDITQAVLQHVNEQYRTTH